VLGVAAAVLGALLLRRPAPLAEPLQFSIAAPSGTSFNFVGEEVAGPPALSPDGRWLVFTATDGTGKSLLWLRAMDSVQIKPLSGTDNASHPFWSPDNRFIGFFAEGKLKKVDVAGGAPEIVCPYGSTLWNGGGTWASDGTILFAATVLQRVAASGGTPQPVTRTDPARVHLWPSFLPDGEHFLYLSLSRDPRGDASQDGIYVGSLASKDSRRILRYSSKSAYVPSGHLLAVSDGNLLAVPFDVRKLETTGQPFQVADRLGSDLRLHGAFFTVSSTGILAYQTSDAAPGLAQLTWFDRSGNRLGTVGEPRVYEGVRRSPDGRRAAVEVWREGLSKEIWLVEFSAGLGQRITSGGWAESPAWCPDGRRIAYAAELSPGRYEIREKNLAESGREEALFRGERYDWTGDWSSDGHSILLTSLKPGSGQRFFLSLLSLPERKVTPWLVTEADERDPVFSPDGRWEAHGSNESGLYEIYVRPFPGPGGRWQMSRSAGSQARWRGDGRELFYLSSDGRVMSVEAKATPSGFEAGPPKVLFEAPVAKPVLYPSARFDVSADGQRFLIACPVGGPSSPPLTVMVNWREGLAKTATR
ncbi:MAG: TolB family protein, partial [Syntrophomonadaceae bacterium]